jgi:hypothetical protein
MITGHVSAAGGPLPSGQRWFSEEQQTLTDGTSSVGFGAKLYVSQKWPEGR